MNKLDFRGRNQHTNIPLEERFLEKVIKTDTCWLWIGNKNIFGYGVFFKDGKNRRAHRISYELYKGQIPDNLLVCHKCDVRNCVNPDHLFLGTAQENIQDAYAKGKFKDHCGEKSHYHKLDANKVKLIRELYIPNVFPMSKLAEMFSVNHTSIHNIISYKTWKNV